MPGIFGREITKYTVIRRAGQNHIYMVYARYFWQGNHQIYGVQLYSYGRPYDSNGAFIYYILCHIVFNAYVTVSSVPNDRTTHPWFLCTSCKWVVRIRVIVTLSVCAVYLAQAARARAASGKCV
jgi:hypothetical protein